MDEDREASVASSVDFYESDKTVDPSPDDVSHGTLPTKRKAEAHDTSPEKKRRLDSPPASSSLPGLETCCGLPAAAWQHIFLLCPVATLGRLLSVNRAFHSYLTSVRTVPHGELCSGSLRLLKSESIWAAARNALPKKPPKPLPGFSELQMWQLVWSRNCQFCGKSSSFIPGEKIWQQGPGASGVRTVWPFAVRTCGHCLKERSQTDSSLLFSAASALRPALPYALITSDQHYIPAYTLQSAITPADVEIAKYYYKDHVNEIAKELEQAQGLGLAAAEEWFKGLDSRGKERMKAAENWERWEVRYQWWLEHEKPKRAVSLAPSNASTQQMVRSPTRRAPSPVVHAPVPHTAAPAYMQARPATIPPQAFTPQPTPGGSRNLHDANEAKAIRKAEIERRCLELDPPIHPNVLRHMDSFKAAIQISHPMTDYAWSVLQPRLLAQYAAAQQAEIDHVSRASTMTTRTADRRLQETSLRESKEVMDREWDEAQRPIREKLSIIAENFINRDWDGGRAVTYDNCPKFAVDLLVHVRRMFYEGLERNDGGSSSSQLEHDSPNTAETYQSKLVLDNMKWVYDNKLKPLTEQFRKELFLCYGSGCEGNTKFYGFEGVIQHFGAKHTNTFSVGNIIVAWREAEWPEETPFHPDPISAKHTYQKYGSYYGGYSRADTSTPQMPPHFPQASPGPYAYSGNYNGPFAPPQASSVIPGIDYGNTYSATMDPYSSYQSVGTPYGPQGNTNGYMTSPAMVNIALAPPPAGQSQIQTLGEPVSQAPASDPEYRTSSHDQQVSSIIQMALDIWKQTSGVKDLPNSVRIYVLLQRVISKFQLEFNHEPHLSHLLDALSSPQISKALKNAPGLSCKACQDGVYQNSTAFPAPSEERKTYTVLNLISHFRSQHIVSPTSGYGSTSLASHSDWKEDMIELPSDRLIEGLIHAPGMDDDKLHTIATVFPKLFPTPLPRIGFIEGNGVASPADSSSEGSKDTRDVSRAAGTPGVPVQKSGPSSLTVSHVDSPQPPKLKDEEYDPLRPALPSSANQSAIVSNKRYSYGASPPLTQRRPQYYREARYYLPRDDLDNHYTGHRDYVELPNGARIIREGDPAYEEAYERRPVHCEHDEFFIPSRDHVVYSPSRERGHFHEYQPYPEQIRYVDHEFGRREYPLARESRPGDTRTQADRFLDELVPGQPPGERRGLDLESSAVSQATLSGMDRDDGSRYSPPPPQAPFAEDQEGQRRSLVAVHPTAPSTVSNGSRHEEPKSGDRHIPTPDSGGPHKRTGPNRRKERHNDYVPSRYYRYMSVAREDPYPRGSSMSRSQSRRYERYEEQRRRLDQQDTPQPGADRDYDPAYSRDQSADQVHAVDPYRHQIRHAPREVEYVPLQERVQVYSPPRRRYAGPPEDLHTPRRVYLDEYDRPVPEYEVIRVSRDFHHRPTRDPYYPHAPTRYLPDQEPDHIEYVPMPYDRPPSQRYDDRPNPYVYYEERVPLPRRPAPPSGYEPEEPPYEPPPPEIKVEGAADTPGGL